DRGTKASDAGLRAGDVIVEANQVEIEDVDDLKDAIAKARKQGKKHALLRISRKEKFQFVTIATGKN
ncbi:MAG: PDZ domain-containing protein, partial [Rickettsiales bacterium]|nr:PDZ domain-containing protein [Rickettsiales bacterium]